MANKQITLTLPDGRASECSYARLRAKAEGVDVVAVRYQRNGTRIPNESGAAAWVYLPAGSAGEHRFVAKAGTIASAERTLVVRPWDDVVRQPPAALVLEPAVPSAKDKRFFARVAEDVWLFPGTRMRYEGFVGVTGGTKHVPAEAVYQEADYRAEYPVWADILGATAFVEGGGSFLAVNTYDSASFTFGFAQFGAHTYGKNLHRLFVRWLLTLRDTAPAYLHWLRLPPEALTWPSDETLAMPKLQWRNAAGGFDPIVARSDNENVRLRRELKPEKTRVTSREVDLAARLMWFNATQPDARHVQVKLAVDQCGELLAAAARSKPLKPGPTKASLLHGKPDYLCAVVYDIVHQGRGGKGVTYTRIANALQAKDDAARYAALLAIGATGYPDRVKDLRKKLDSKVAAGELGTTTYDEATGTFV